MTSKTDQPSRVEPTGEERAAAARHARAHRRPAHFPRAELRGRTRHPGPAGRRPADLGRAGPGHPDPRAVAVPGAAAAGRAGRADRAGAAHVPAHRARRPAAHRRAGLGPVLGHAGRHPGFRGLRADPGDGPDRHLGHAARLRDGRHGAAPPGRRAGARFDAAMSERTKAFAPSVADRYDFSGLRTVADIGGGQGILLAAILRAHQHAARHPVRRGRGDRQRRGPAPRRGPGGPLRGRHRGLLRSRSRPGRTPI